MAGNANEMRRIMLAVTETTSLPELWAAVMEHLAETPAELITVFVSDDRWRRAASLSFTREISRIGGSSCEFTPQRAEQLGREAATRTQGLLQKLAADAKIQAAFETLEQHETTRVQEFIMSESDVLIAPSGLQAWPIFAELSRLKCQILLVDTKDEETQSPTT